MALSGRYHGQSLGSLAWGKSSSCFLFVGGKAGNIMVILFFFRSLSTLQVSRATMKQKDPGLLFLGQPPEWGVGFTWSDEAEVPWASVPNPPSLLGRSSGDEAEVPRTSVPYNSPWNLSGQGKGFLG